MKENAIYIQERFIEIYESIEFNLDKKKYIYMKSNLSAISAVYYHYIPNIFHQPNYS